MDAAPGHLQEIAVRGADAHGFLQDQLSADLDAEAVDLAAWCDAKGRVRALFRTMRREDGWDLALPEDLAATVRDQLSIFVMRSAVTLELAQLRPYDPLAEVRAGRPQVHPATADDFLPMLLNLDLLDGLARRKGCYPGQGVINRAMNLGRTKRRTLRYAIAGPPPAPGAEVMLAERRVGTVLEAAASDEGCELLAVVNLSDADSPLTVHGAGMQRLGLPYDVPDLGD